SVYHFRRGEDRAAKGLPRIRFPWRRPRRVGRIAGRCPPAIHRPSEAAMSKRTVKPGVLRRLAEDFLRQFAEEDEFPDGEREDLITSLVRQWVTYDGKAVLFVEEQ